MRRTVAMVLAWLVWLTLLPSSEAQAFCGFYVSGADGKLFNNATMVALMREGQRTVLSMQNNYEGPPENFAMVVPVPVVLQEQNVKTLPAAIFDRLDKLAAPRLVEYWEQDPCKPPVPAMNNSSRPRTAAMPMKESDGPGQSTVKVEAQFTVGEYDIVILSASDSSGLDAWLKSEGYNIPDGAEPLLRPYVEQGSKFFVAKVDVAKVKKVDGRAKLSPLRFHYDTNNFTLPIRLGLMNSKGAQDLIVHILARGQRYEVANYPNVTIPTNIDVDDETKAKFGEFYAALFDATVQKTKGAVVTEYAWDANSCDPCPVPALHPEELATLGLDVLDGANEPMDPTRMPASAPQLSPYGFVLTRLHARYTKESLGEDLVFKKADPILGGREFRTVEGGALEHGAVPGGINNFQGRYAIRHRWKGAVECAAPNFGIWGPPPDNAGEQGKVSSALDLAFAKRDAVDLPAMIRSPIPELDLKPSEPKKAEPAAASPSAAPPGTPAPSSTDCGCRTVGRGGAPAWSALFALSLLALRRRRSKPLRTSSRP